MRIRKLARHDKGYFRINMERDHQDSLRVGALNRIAPKTERERQDMMRGIYHTIFK